jgi:hypothetical protein
MQCTKKKLEFTDIINLPYFNNWFVGFTIAEGSFHIKAKGTAQFSIVQSGIENYQIIKAIHYFIKGPDSLNHQIKPENYKVYRISFSSTLAFYLLPPSFRNGLSPIGHRLLLHASLRTPEQRQSTFALLPPNGGSRHPFGLRQPAKEKDLNFIIIFFDNNLLGLKKLQFDNWKSYIISKMNDSAPNVILPKVSNNNINDSRIK